MPELTPEQKAQLDKNIRSMLSQGASQDDVTNYANDFKLKYDTELKKKGSVSSGVENTTASNGLSGGRLGKSATDDPDRLYQAMVKQSHSGTPQQQPIAEKVEIDYKDPIGSQLRPIKERQKQLQDLRRGVESVEQNTAQKLGYSNEITGLAKQESNLLSQRFGHSAEAQGFVEDMLDKSKLRLKPGKEMAFPNVPTLDDFTEESFAEASPKYNATFNIAVDQVRRNKEVKDALATSTTLGDAAVKRAMAKRTLQGKQATELGGDVPNSMKGAMLIDFLNDPDFQEAAAENPLLAKQAEREAKELPENFPDAAIRIIAQAVSAERERKGMNSAILNNPSIKNSEEIVNELVEKGELPEQYKDFYSNPAVKFAVNFKLKTPGLVENFGSGIEQGITGMGKSVADLTQVRKLYSSKDDRLFKTLEKDYENFALKPKGLLHNITSYGGNILGQIVPMVGGGMAARGVGLIKGENTANAVMTGLQTWGENRDRALADLPGDSEGVQFGYATINTGIEVALANVLNDTKLARQLLKGTSPEVKTVISKFTNREITAAVAKQEINNIFSKALQVGSKFAKFAKGTVKTAHQEAKEEWATQVLQTANNQAFGGEPQSVSQQMSDAFEVYATTFLGSLVPGAGGGVVEVNRNPEMGKLVFEMASNPEKYVDIMKGQAAIDLEYAKDIEQKLDNLQYIVSVKNELDGRDMKDSDKEKFLAKSLAEKVLTDKNKSVPDKSLNKEADKKLAEIAIEKEQIINPETSNTKLVQEFYDNELLGKTSIELLSVRDEDGKPTNKFDESKVGEYLKEVAQRTNNLDSDWKPNEVGDSSQAAKSSYPEAIVEAANKRWGKEVEAAENQRQAEIDQELAKNPPIDQKREMADESTPDEKIVGEPQSPSSSKPVSSGEGDLPGEIAKTTSYPFKIYKGDVGEVETTGEGISFFTRDKQGADYYTKSREEQGLSKGKKTFEGYIETKNPLIVDAKAPSPIPLIDKNGNKIAVFGETGWEQKVKDSGYDAVIINRKFENDTPIEGWEIVSFNKSQIKELPSTLSSNTPKEETGSVGVGGDVENKIKALKGENDEYVYHGTKDEFIESVAKDGLKLGTKWATNGRVFLSMDEKLASVYGKVLRIKKSAINDLQKSDRSKRVIDLDVYETKQPISPNDIEIKTDNGWQPLTKAVEKSLKEQTKAEGGNTKEQGEKRAALEAQRDAEILDTGKPEIRMEFVAAKELVDSKDPIVNKKVHSEIKEKYKALKNLLDCLWQKK